MGAPALASTQRPPQRGRAPGGHTPPPAPPKPGVYLEKTGRPGAEGKDSTSTRPPDTFFSLLRIYFSPRSSLPSNCSAITGANRRAQPLSLGASARPARARPPASPAGPASRGWRPPLNGAILTKGPFRPLLKLNAIGTG